MADALVKYQMNLLGAMNDVNEKIERAERGEEVIERSGSSSGIGDVTAQLAKLEGGEKKLQKELDGLATELEGFTRKLKQSSVSHHLDFFS